jgi:Arc/MetJ family transcription regulator
LRDPHRGIIIQLVKTNIDVDGELFKKAQRAAGKTSKAQVVELALRAFIEQEARKRLAALEGSIPKAKAGRRQRTRRGAA